MATIFVDSKKRTPLEVEVGGGSYFTSELFVCEGTYFIKCNRGGGGRGE